VDRGNDIIKTHVIKNTQNEINCAMMKAY